MFCKKSPHIRHAKIKNGFILGNVTTNGGNIRPQKFIGERGKMEKKIKLGVFGAGRGGYLAAIAAKAGFELVALCDVSELMCRHAVRKLGADGAHIRCYSDYDKFLEHDFDAVLLANYATQHAPAAIKALKAGKHVMSEVMAFFTMGEALELAEAVEQSDRVYYFAENYPYSVRNLEMTRRFRSGEMGKFIYGEAEYVHPTDARERAELTSGPDHWRSWLPVTYYCTHSMGPVMRITGSRPVRVNGFVVPHDFDDPNNRGGTVKVDDTMSILMCQMDNGALVKIMPCAKLRDHGNRVRICGNRGCMEWTQADDKLLRVRKMKYDRRPEEPEHIFYRPQFPAEFQDAGKTGHGGGDYFTSRCFAAAIRGEIPPDIDIYQAIDMTSIGILGYKSALEHGTPQEVVDFRDKVAREKFRNDNWNPDPARPCADKPFPSVLGKIKIPPEELEMFRKLRAEYEDSLVSD